MREFLEKNYTDDAIETDDLTIKLVIKALLEVSALGTTPTPTLTGWACWVAVCSVYRWTGLPRAEHETQSELAQVTVFPEVCC